KARSGCAEVWDSLPAQRTDVSGLQIRSAEGDAGHPGRDTAARCEEHILGDCAGEELLFQRVDLRGVAFIEQGDLVALRREHEEFVGVDACAPEVADAVERDAVRPCAFAEAARREDLAIA